MFLLLAVLLANPILSGRVTDRDGRAVPGAAIRALVEGAAPVEAVTDERGRFRLEVAGRFRLEIRRPGYRTLLSSEADLLGDGVYQVDRISLLLGDPADIEIVDLQVRNPDDLLARGEPGIAEGLPKADRLFGLRGGINVTGIAEGEGQQWIAASGSVFGSSSISSGLALGSTNLSAALGDSGTAGQSLPAGQEAPHGSLYGYHRNDALNARNFFDSPEAPIPPFKYYFFGGDAGGAAGEGTYYYAQYWGLRIRQSITRAATVPDPRWLEGDFSMLPGAIVDPDTTIAFPGNRIPAGRLDAAGLALARIYPRPNVAGASTQNYRAVGRIVTAADSAGARIDRRLTESDELSIEYEYARDTTDDPFNLLSGITNLPFFGVRDALQTHSLRIADTHVFSASGIGQFRFSMDMLTQPRSLLQTEGGTQPGPAILMTGLSNLGYAANTPQERRNRAFEGSGSLSWQHGGAVTRFGGAVRHFPFRASLDLYTRGQFQFTNGIAGHGFANLLLGYPANALRLEGDTMRRFTTSAMSVFIEHDRQLLPRLTLSAGLRYDYQTPFRELDGKAANFDPATGRLAVKSSALYEGDSNNFGPRVGLSWIGPKETVVRAGYGVFHDTLAVGDSLFLLGLNPPFVQFTVRNNGDVLPQFNLETAFDDTVAAIPPSIFSTPRRLANPNVQHWDLSVERQLPWSLTATVSYAGQRGARLRRQINLNQPTPGEAVSLDERRPYPAFRNIFQFETSASSIAHAGEVQVSREFAGGPGFLAVYRYSRIIDDATLISMLPQDSHNLRAERGRADFDVRHRLVFSGNWNLPGVASIPLTERWQLQATGTFQSGMPLSAVMGTDSSGTGSPIVNRPDLVGDPDIDDPTPSRFFNPDAFRAPEEGRFGNSGRNVITGPGIGNVDLALVRAFRTTDATRLQLRIDAYNALNHPNFAAPPSLQNFADSPDFGALFIARSPRILQIGLKFLW